MTHTKFKKCTQCRTEKSLEDFYKDKRKTDNLTSECKSCHGRFTASWQRSNKNLMAKYHRDRYRSNEQYRLGNVLRQRLSAIIRQSPKSGKMLEHPRCSIWQFQAHIEQLMTDEMTWENRGTVWQFDHIRPLSSFDLTDPIQFQAAQHYTNIQPLLVEDNYTKGVSRPHKNLFASIFHDMSVLSENGIDYRGLYKPELFATYAEILGGAQ